MQQVNDAEPQQADDAKLRQVDDANQRQKIDDKREYLKDKFILEYENIVSSSNKMPGLYRRTEKIIMQLWRDYLAANKMLLHSDQSSQNDSEHIQGARKKANAQGSNGLYQRAKIISDNTRYRIKKDIDNPKSEQMIEDVNEIYKISDDTYFRKNTDLLPEIADLVNKVTKK